MINRSRRFWLRRATVAVAPALPFISFIGHAQQPTAVLRIGMLLVARTPNHEDIQKFRDGLKEAGYVDGSSFPIQYAVADGDYERLPELAAALVHDNVQVIVVEGSVTALAAAHATSSIPIVMASVGDPVGTGLVSSLKHPGGNVTGLSMR